MKMADLNPGTEYLAASGTDWKTSEYRSNRVRVLSTDRLVAVGRRYGSKPVEPMEVTLDGVTYKAHVRTAQSFDRVDSVLVLPLDRKTGLATDNATPRLMPLRDVRGEWATLWPEVQKRVQSIAQHRRAAEQARTLQADRLKAAIEVLEARGVKMPHAGSWSTSVDMGPDALEQIIALIG